jgi:hypothetical protein
MEMQRRRGEGHEERSLQMDHTHQGLTYGLDPHWPFTHSQERYAGIQRGQCFLSQQARFKVRTDNQAMATQLYQD